MAKDLSRLNVWAAVVLSFTYYRLHLRPKHAQWAQVFMFLDSGLAALSKRRQTAKDLSRLNVWAALLLSFIQNRLHLRPQHAPWAQ